MLPVDPENRWVGELSPASRSGLSGQDVWTRVVSRRARVTLPSSSRYLARRQAREVARSHRQTWWLSAHTSHPFRTLEQLISRPSARPCWPHLLRWLAAASPGPSPLSLRRFSIWIRTRLKSGRWTFRTATAGHEFFWMKTDAIVWLIKQQIYVTAGFKRVWQVFWGCCLWFHPPPLSSCFPPEFLPLRRWAEFHTGVDAPFVGFVSTWLPGVLGWKRHTLKLSKLLKRASPCALLQEDLSWNRG